jgi:hypothetical protein
VTGFAIPRAYDEPTSPQGAQWVFDVKVKAFEANTPALLEAAVNAWLTTLQTLVDEPAVLSINYQSAAKERALVTYGYFVRVTATV